MKTKLKHSLITSIVLIQMITLFFFVTTVSAAEGHYPLGAIPTPAETLAAHSSSRINNMLQATTTPSSIDWSDYMPNVGNQGAQGSCTAWSTGYYYKSYQEKREHGWSNWTPVHQFSPSYIYNQINGGKDQGAYISSAFNIILTEGVDTLADCPYYTSDYLTQPTPAQEERASHFKSSNWTSLYPSYSTNTLKAALVSGPIVVGSQVFWGNNWGDTGWDYSGNINYQDVSNGHYAGNHAICIVGYDDNHQTTDGNGAFKFINSWGPNWGSSGYGWISYTYASTSNYFFEAMTMTDALGDSNVDYAVGGYVYNATSLPVTINISRISGSGAVPGSISTTSGSFSQSGFEEDTTYRLTPSAPGYYFEPGYTDIDSNYRQPGSISFSAYALNGPYISLNSPQNFSNWMTGSMQQIGWSYGGGISNASTVNIELMQNGVLVRPIASGIAAGVNGTGSLNWTLPNDLAAGYYTIKVSSVSNPGVYGTSLSFTISAPEIKVSSPGGAYNWPAGSTQQINWTYTGNINSMQIDLLKGGNPSSVICQSTSAGSNGSGSYSWAVPAQQAASNDYQVKITNKDNPSISVTSGLFSICTVPQVTTLAATDVSGTYAMLNGRIVDNGAQDCEVIKFQYQIQGSDSWTDTVGLTGPFATGSTFNLYLEGLTPNTTYNIRALAYNDAGWGCDQQNPPVSFTTANVPYCDLIINTVEGPAKGAAGGTIPVTITVYNTGNVSAGSTYVGCYIRGDNNGTYIDSQIGTCYIAEGIPAGTERTVIVSSLLPANLSNNNYSIFAYADSTDTVNELNEINNGTYSDNDIYISAPFRDLVLSSVDGPEEGSSGGSITVADTISNHGNAATGVFYIKYYLSTDTTITTTDVLLGQRQVSGLAVEASNSASTTFTIPASTTGGTYYIGAIADATNLIAESNESNNSAYDVNPIAVTGLFKDLVITAVNGPATGAPGASVTISDTVMNNGNAAAGAFTVAYYLSNDATITSADTKLGTRSVTSLAAGATNSGSKALTLPGTLGNGTYYLGAMADSAGAIIESNEVNNTGCDSDGMVVTAPYRDLAVSAVAAPAAGAIGSSMTVANTVVNNGNASAGASTVRFYLSSDVNISTADISLGQRSITNLAAGASSTANTTLTIPSTVGAGEYYVGAIADATSAVAESDEANNAGCDSDSIVVTAPYRDLAISAIDAPANAATRSKIVVANTVVNNGNASAGASTVRFYLSSDTNITTADIALGQRSVAALAAGASSTANTTLTLPSTVGAGEYYVGAIADATSAVAESDEANNIACDAGSINISAPDLEMTSVDGPDSVSSGGNITIIDQVTNTSAVPSLASIIKYYLSNDPSITTSDRLLGQRSVPILAAGAANNGSVSIKIAATVPGGTYYLGAIADATNLVMESNEGNNTACDAGQITIVAPFKDLAVAAVDGPAAGVRGASITVSDTIMNNGNTASGAFTVAYYLSSDATITSTDTKLGTRSVTSLAAGASSSGSKALTLPSTLGNGTYYLGVMADSTSAVTELNESNNTGCDTDSIVVTAPYRDLEVSAIDAPDAGSAGTNILLTNTVINNGNASAGTSTVRFYLSSDTTINTADRLLGQRSISSLAAGASSRANTTLTIPATVAAGDYYVGAIADAASNVIESNEANNTAYDAFVINS